VKWGTSGSESSATVDVEFAETLGEVKQAIEEATNNDVVVSFDRTNRLGFSLASGDDNQVVFFEEIGASLDVANQLGLIHSSSIMGRALRDGATHLLANSTKLSEIDLIIDGTTNNNLVLNTSEGNLTLDLTNSNTMGDVISIINASTQSDSGESISIEAKIVNNQYLEVTDLVGNPLTAVTSVTHPAASKLGLTPDSDLNGESVFYSDNLEPIHQSENFFSALTVLRNEFQSSAPVSHSLISNTLGRLQSLQNQLLESRGEAGGRILRMEHLQSRYQEEALYVEGLYGEKTGIDILEVTQRYLQQQQVYEAGLSVASRILGTSLFSYI
jgi:flagellin-like hook-associated protein FlgL